MKRSTLLIIMLLIKCATVIVVTLWNYDAILRTRQSPNAIGDATMSKNATNTIKKPTIEEIESMNIATATIINEDVIREMLLCITDNGGATADRYSVYLKDGSVLGLSHNPTSPQGFSQWSEYDPSYIQDIHTRDVNETLIPFAEFPLKDHVISRIREAYRDYVVFCKQSNASDKEIRAGILEDYARLQH